MVIDLTGEDYFFNFQKGYRLNKLSCRGDFVQQFCFAKVRGSKKRFYRSFTEAIAATVGTLFVKVLRLVVKVQLKALEFLLELCSEVNSVEFI